MISIRVRRPINVASAAWNGRIAFCLSVRRMGGGLRSVRSDLARRVRLCKLRTICVCHRARRGAPARLHFDLIVRLAVLLSRGAPSNAPSSFCLHFSAGESPAQRLARQ